MIMIPSGAQIIIFNASLFVSKYRLVESQQSTIENFRGYIRDLDT